MGEKRSEGHLLAPFVEYSTTTTTAAATATTTATTTATAATAAAHSPHAVCPLRKPLPSLFFSFFSG
jgi:hypothetical protein